jgi:acetyl-CoA synthetase
MRGTRDTTDTLGMGDVVSNESLANLLKEETGR